MCDLIKREDAMGAVQDHFNADGFRGYDDGQKMMDRIKALPSAETHEIRTETHGVCSDLIKREDAIEAIKTLWIKDETDTNKRQYNIALQHCISTIRNTTSTNDNWIPVSERLPRYNEYVLVTRQNAGMPIIVDRYSGYYGDDIDDIDTWYEGWDYSDERLKVIAWQPLPTPYKESEVEE